MNSTCINSLGLIVGMVGSLMILIFVPKIDLVEVNGHARLVLADPNQQQIKAYKRRVFLYRVGVILLVFGFILQLVSNYAGR